MTFSCYITLMIVDDMGNCKQIVSPMYFHSCKFYESGNNFEAPGFFLKS